MNRVLAVVGGVSLCIAIHAHSQSPAPPAPKAPKVYALVAAMGDQFTLASGAATPRTGSHISPYRQRTTDVPGNILNRITLHSLDAAVTKIDSGGQKIYLSLAPAPMEGVAPAQRESVAITRIVAELSKMSQRTEWDRIVVATPAYRALDANGMPPKLQGFGLYSEQRCQACGGIRGDANGMAAEPPGGVDAVTSEDQAIRARTFLAPFSYIKIWILDPKTLAVIDTQQGFDSQKLAEPMSKPTLDIGDERGQKYVARRITALIDLSVGTAVMRSELNGGTPDVEVGEIRDVTRPPVTK